MDESTASLDTSYKNVEVYLQFQERNNSTIDHNQSVESKYNRGVCWKVRDSNKDNDASTNTFVSYKLKPNFFN